MVLFIQPILINKLHDMLILTACTYLVWSNALILLIHHYINQVSGRANAVRAVAIALKVLVHFSDLTLKKKVVTYFMRLLPMKCVNFSDKSGYGHRRSKQ